MKVGLGALTMGASIVSLAREFGVERQRGGAQGMATHVILVERT